MKILWLFVILPTTEETGRGRDADSKQFQPYLPVNIIQTTKDALTQPGFGRSYLRNSRLCHQWSCVNSKLRLTDSLPPIEEFRQTLKSLLPLDAWQDVVENVLVTCYNNRSRIYTNTCPGQAIMHCAVDQLISNCPEESLKEGGDACAPVNSLAGVNNMFTQSRYENLERNMAFDRRPAWFLKNYFSSKCCNLPDLFNSTALTECGFNSMIQYYTHNVMNGLNELLPPQARDNILIATTPTNADKNGDSLQVVDFKNFYSQNNQATDPLDCCEISEFIQPSWRQECGFQLNWDQRRLVINGASDAYDSVTTTVQPYVRQDVVVVPRTCPEETCVFKKLNIITDSGSVDIEGFTKLLDNMTNVHSSWSKAKARVVTTCLRKPLTEYEGDCEINKILACTFDVLTENCPNATKNDLCSLYRHTKNDRVCQISSSKYRPKNRREVCSLPELVSKDLLDECNIDSLTFLKTVSTASKPKKHTLFTSKYKCQDLTPSTSCLMEKMGILNKYGFMDYFKMKDRIRSFTQNEWATLQDTYFSAFNNGPLYTEHCNSAKKFLNVVDSILMTCPASKRKNTPQCSNIFNVINNTPAIKHNATQEQTHQTLEHFLHVFYPPQQIIPPNIVKKHTKKIVKTPLFNYGILNSNDAPEVETITVKPKVVKQPLALLPVNRPLVILPVYMRVPHSNLAFRPYGRNDGILRHSFWQHQTTESFTDTTASSVLDSSSASIIMSTESPIQVSTSTYGGTDISNKNETL